MVSLQQPLLLLLLLWLKALMLSPHLAQCRKRGAEKAISANCFKTLRLLLLSIAFCTVHPMVSSNAHVA
jgi:hypothetical protein